MFMLNHRKHGGGICVGTALVVLAAAHVAAGVLLYKSTCHHSATLPRMVKRAKRTVTGLIREII